jgi:hypothetical protein
MGSNQTLIPFGRDLHYPEMGEHFEGVSLGDDSYDLIGYVYLGAEIPQ